MKHEFVCSQCKESKTHEDDLTTGYGTNVAGDKICFSCCGLNDAKELEELHPKQKICLYLDTKEKKLTNWPGTLSIPLAYIREGKHNIAGKRFDTWFKFRGSEYHAVQYGTNTQIAHIRRLK